MKLVIKYVVAPHGLKNPLPKLMLVYHGPLPLKTRMSHRDFCCETSSTNFITRCGICLTLVNVVVRLRRRMGNLIWDRFLNIKVSDLAFPMFVTEDTAAGDNDDLLMRNYAVTKEQPGGTPRPFGSGLPSDTPGSLRPPSRSGSRDTCPVGTRSPATENHFAEEKGWPASAIAEADNTRAQLQALGAGGGGGQRPTQPLLHPL